MPAYGGPAQTRTQLEVDILATRERQRLSQQQLEEAVSAEIHALHLLDASRSIQERARRQVGEFADAISSLQDELALIPAPRLP